jgi:tetratricopeptide (TPR) repeat protein
LDVRNRSAKRQVVEQLTCRKNYYPPRKNCQAFLREKQTLSAPENRIQNAPMSRSRLIALLLALTTLVVYLPVTRDSFLDYDDNDYVTNNQVVQKGLTFAGIKWAFTTWHAGNWHPLTWLSHMMDCELFGLNPGAHHFVNVVFHATNAVLLFMLLLRLTGALWPGAFVAALFALHPMHVESIAWVAERKDVLSTFFALLALLSYARYVKENCRGSFWLALIFFALGLMAKPMLVTLPFVMLLLDYWPLNRVADFQLKIAVPTAPSVRPSTFSLLNLEKWPFFLLTVISCVVTFFAQRHGDAVVSLEKVSLHYRLCNTLMSYGRYLLKMIWPADLTVMYPLPSNLSWMIAMAATSAAVLSVIFWFAWRARQTCPYLLVGWLWFLGTLVPVIGLVQVGSAALADRYTYFPFVGVFIAIAFGGRDLVVRFQIPKIIPATSAALVLAACSLLTENQLRYWRDSEALFTHAIALTKDNNVAHVNLGVALEQKGKLKEALAEYREAERLAPELFHIRNNLGNLLDTLGQPDAAQAEYREAIRLNPKAPFLHDGLGIVLVELGRFDEAMNEFTNAAQLDPAYPWPHFQMAKTLLNQGRDAEGVDQFREALRLDPENFQILAYIAHVLAADENPQVRDGKTALVLAAKANALTGGGQPLVLDALAMACAATGDFTNAQEVAQNAVNLATALKLKNIGPMQQRLELYKNHRPWRESFLATNYTGTIHP